MLVPSARNDDPAAAGNGPLARSLDVSSWTERITAALPTGRSLPDELFASRHRALVRVLWLHVVFLPVVALGYSAPLWHAGLEGAIIGAFAGLAWLTRKSSRRLQATVGAMGLLTCSAVLVHITGGLIEAHFHFFVVVTALSLYEDWVVFGLSIAYVLLHHGIGSAAVGEDVFAHTSMPWKWAAIHALFILALCVANIAVWHSSERVRQVAEGHRADLERSNAELEQFAYVASHDLNEPLRMIASYLKLLERRYGDELGDDGKQFIDYSIEGAERMRTLIDDLLAYSRVGSSSGPLKPVDLGKTVDLTLRALASSVDEAGAEVEVGELPVVRGEETQLGRLFQNLLSNAIKFRDGRPPHVEVAAERNNGEWVFTIADNGIGIPAEQADRVFEMFGRLHTRDAYEGNGIGLATCRRIVERHGGRIWVEPTEGGGSTFRFTIPARSG
jgi:signal transduction histidine kinase